MSATITVLPRRVDAHRRRRYPSDTTDAEWELLAPLLPAPACTTATGGHPEAHPRREIVDAIRYLVDNGCKWRALPSDFPPFQTFAGSSPAGRRTACSSTSVTSCAAASAPPSAGALGQSPRSSTRRSVKAAETVRRDTCGFDGAKLINGRKRHLIVDTKSLLMTVKVTPADATARALLPGLRERNPGLTLIWADNAYTGLADWARNDLDITFKV
jgi:transposase